MSCSRLGRGDHGLGGLVEVQVALAEEGPRGDAFEALGEVGVVVEDEPDVRVGVQGGGLRRKTRRTRRSWPKVTEKTRDLVSGWPRKPSVPRWSRSLWYVACSPARSSAVAMIRDNGPRGTVEGL